MEIRLHKLARTTPAIRQEIQNSKLMSKELSEKYGISLPTVYKWRKRKDVEDRSHARKRLLSKLSEAEEEIIKELRIKLNLSIDDITEVIKRCLKKEITRSSIYRCIKRKNIRKEKERNKQYKEFEKQERPGYIHMDVKYLTRLKGKRSYVYVGIDRATRYVYVEILEDLKPRTAAGFIKRFIKEFDYKVETVLTDNGFEWTDRCAGAIKKKATGKHEVDKICIENRIEHKLTKIRRPETNGMVERFNRRLSELLAQKEKIEANSGKNCFENHEARNKYIKDFVYNYNRTRLRCLNYNAPIKLLIEYKSKVNNQAKDNTKAGICIRERINFARFLPRCSSGLTLLQE